ncbi:RNase A-like domain-containing protein [Cronobacter dublinensis]
MFTNNLVSGITKTRVMSGAFAATLMAFSFSSWALNGPACNVPQPGGEAAWADAQKIERGHLVECHIAKSDEWLKERALYGKDGCLKNDKKTASTWQSAEAMWKTVGWAIEEACKDPEPAEDYINLYKSMKGNASEIVGRVYRNGVYQDIHGDGNAFIKMVKSSKGQWYVLTSYPR